MKETYLTPNMPEPRWTVMCWGANSKSEKKGKPPTHSKS